MRGLLTSIAAGAVYIVFIFCILTAPLLSGDASAAEPGGEYGNLAAQGPHSSREARSRGDEFIPVNDGLSPLSTEIVSLTLLDNPVKEAVYAIAAATGLNVVMASEVDPEVPITISLSGVTAGEALQTILSSVNYFYTLKGNILIISAFDTMIFEMGRPSVIQQYSVNVGGDILGAAKTSGGEVTGEVAQKISSDSSAFRFWDMMEKSLQGILRITPGGSGPAVAARLTVDRMTGTIMVTATRNDLENVERFLTRVMEILNRQVVIEARIMEVKLTDGLKYGIDWSFLGRGVQGLGKIGAGTTKFTDLLGSAANFNFSITGGDFTSILKALKEQGDINVLSNPRINIMNGQAALLSVGRKVDFVSRVESTTLDTTAGTTPTVTFTVETGSILSGIMFGIVPYIEDGGGQVTLAITPVVSDLVKLEDKKIGNVGSNSIDISLPTVDLKELSTTVKVGSGDMVIIGGLIEKKSSRTDSSVPLLGQIPFVGSVFRSRDRSKTKTELVIMIKPMVLEKRESPSWKQ
ncbi:MAG: pilus (MSHA type) biogenesis protein MshL [Thermodesulfobacteriota bacterium]